MQYESFVEAMILSSFFSLFFITGKFIPTKVNYTFLFLIISQLCVVFLNFTLTYMLINLDSYSLFLIHINCLLYFVFFILREYLFLIYTAYSLKFNYNPIWKIIKNFCILLFVLLLALTMSSPWSKLAYALDYENGYTRGEFYNLFYFVLSFYSLLIFYIVFKTKTKHYRRRKNGIILINCIFIIALITRFIFFERNIFDNIIMLGIIIMYFYIHVDFIILDPITKLYQSSVFYELTQDEGFGKKFHTLILHMDNFDFIDYKYVETNLNFIKEHVAASLNKDFPNSYIFYLGGGFFGVINKDRNVIEKNKYKLRLQLLKDQDKFKMPISISSLTIYANNKNINYKKIQKYSTFAFKKLFKDEHAIVTDLSDEIIDIFKEDIKMDNLIGEVAINKDLIDMNFQPIYSCKEDKIVSAEALLRIDGHKFINPEKFISKAEELGFINIISDYILGQSLEMASKYEFDKLGLKYLEINISTTECLRLDLVEAKKKIIDKYDLDLEINFEITESNPIKIEKLSKDMDKLINHGISFSLDDYGTGYSNLINILELPFTIIKIDKSIVWNYFKEGQKNGFLRSLIKMFKESGFYVLAEGVETKTQLNGLKALGCDFIQGYYFSKPIKALDFKDFVKKFNKI